MAYLNEHLFRNVGGIPTFDNPYGKRPNSGVKNRLVCDRDGKPAFRLKAPLGGSRVKTSKRFERMLGRCLRIIIGGVEMVKNPP